MRVMPQPLRKVVKAKLSIPHFAERGCVSDQPQRAARPERLGFFNVLRLVEDDTAALWFKMGIAELNSVAAPDYGTN